jgi:hypothetical protein
MPGRSLAAWLNGLPEVAELLRDAFDGKPVNEQYLSDWRQGGPAPCKNQLTFFH